MTSSDLINALKASGTGEAKLEAARRAAERKGIADAHELVHAMRESRAWPEGTVEKAGLLLGGLSPLDEKIQGTPPKKGPPPEEVTARAIEASLGGTLKQIADSLGPREKETLLDHPDPKLRDKAEEAGEEVAGRHADRQADAQSKGVGNPVKPGKK